MRNFKFLIHIECGQIYCETENQGAEIFTFLFSILHSNVIHREICVKDFSGSTVPRILKFGTHIGYYLLFGVKENHPPTAYHYLYL